MIEFTRQERSLLEAKPPDQTPLEIQLARMLRLALRPEQCPACKFVLSLRSAWAGEGPFDPRRHGDGPGYACTMCEARLEHWTDAGGGHGMVLASGQQVRVYGPEAM